MHVHEQKWTNTKKKKKIDDACPWTKWTDQKKYIYIDDEVTLSHIGKSMTKSRRTKYLKNGTLIEDYNVSQMLEIRASRILGAMYQWPTV